MEDEYDNDGGLELNNIDEPGIEDILGQNNHNPKICDNYICVFIVHFIQSLISIGLFIVYHIFNIHAKNPIEYNIISLILLASVIIFIIFINYFGESKFYFSHKKYGPLILFILMNAFKNIFEILFIFMLVQNPKEINDEEDLLNLSVEPINQLEFQQLEIRIFWKISMCGLYLILILYFCFKKDKNNFKYRLLLIMLSISIIIFFLLLFIFQRSFEFKRFGIYLIFMILELIVMESAMILENEAKKDVNKGRNLFSGWKRLDWKINRIDFIKFNVFFIILSTPCKDYDDDHDQSCYCYDNILYNFK